VGERKPREDDSPWRVTVGGLVASERVLALQDLLAMPQVERSVDIHCVTRWSKLGAKFSGVPLAELLGLAEPAADARFISFVARSDRGHSTSLPLDEALRLETLVALGYEGQPLALEHGGPVRTVVPGRYFYKSIKWLERIELLAEDRLGYWEAVAGYHNMADPWLQQRFMAPTVSKQQAAAVIASRDFSGRDLRSIDAAGRDLAGLNARGALLRDANFRGATLRRACFDGANLSLAHLQRADLREASFRQADLEGVNFCGADLRGADLTGASLFGATFVGVDAAAEGAEPLAAVFDPATRIDLLQLEALTPDQRIFLQNAGGGTL
jgi:hypothetical protein